MPHTRGVIHRDLKPANVLLGPGNVIKISDFGLAKSVDQEGQTLSGTIIGTPEYMSPEQASGQTRDVTNRSDVYALGVMLYEMLDWQTAVPRGHAAQALQKVVDEEPVPPRQLTRDIPYDLEIICLKAMAKESKRRYLTAADLAADLQFFARGTTDQGEAAEPDVPFGKVRPPPPGPAGRDRRWYWPSS